VLVIDLPEASNHSSDAGSTFAIGFGPAPPEDILAARWRDLERRADGSFFTGWTWTGCLFAKRFNDPWLLEVTRDGETVGLALFNRRTLPLGANRFDLHCAGKAALDATFIEHNGLLVARAAPIALDTLFIALGRLAEQGRFSRRIGGAIIHLPGIGRDVAAAAAHAGRLAIDAERAAPYRDLARLREAGGDLLASISANSRSQMRRSIRLYGRAGPIRVERAETLETADAYFRDLVALHRTRWLRRGKAGAFTEATLDFHRTLIGRGLALGEVDLLRISAGERRIGYLLNFVFAGVVSAYQAGFDYDRAARHEKPGLTCHDAAIGYYLTRGDVVRYDFLAGAERYKETLSDGAETLTWARVALGPGSLADWRLRSEIGLRGFKHAVSDWLPRRARSTAAGPVSALR